MPMTVNFRGGETAGGVSEKQIETAKQETTGGVGARQKQDLIFLSEEPKCDTVCFRGQEYPHKTAQKTSFTSVILGTLGFAGAAVALLGLARKYDILNEYVKNENILKYANKVTEPCYQACKWIKNNSYDKIVNYVKTKK